MAQVTCTPAQVAPVSNTQPEIVTLIAAAAIERGDVIALDSNGKAALLEADSNGPSTLVGIAISKAGAGQPVSVLARGYLYGFALSGLAFGAKVYTGATGGQLTDALVATYGQTVGRVASIEGTKVLEVCPNNAAGVGA